MENEEGGEEEGGGQGLALLEPGLGSMIQTQVETERLNEVSVPPLSPRTVEARGDPLGLGAELRSGDGRGDGFE